MYSFINKSNFLILLMVFSAMTYLTTAFGTEYRLIARGEERREGGGGERREGGGEQNRGGEQYRGYEDRGGSHSYSNYGHSYSQEGKEGAAFGAGAAAGSSQNQGSTQYVPVDTYQPNSQPVENYPYQQNPY